jgi:hypothetical protein
MARLQDRVRKHDAVWWQWTGDDAFGDPEYAEPADVKVWWVDKTEEFLDSTGTRVVSNAMVIVGSEGFKVGDLLKRGLVEDLDPGITNPEEHPNTYPIRAYMEVEDTIGNLGTLRKAML